MPANGSADPTPVPVPRGARTALLLLVAINLFNYIDRYVLAALQPNIRVSLAASGASISSQEMGYLVPAFMVTYMLFAPLFGWLGDRTSRWKLIAVGVILWSLASGASGLATTFALLFFTRCFVGIGEAAYGPVAPTIIADFYPVARRGQVLAWFYCAIPVGSALGYALGGQVSAHVDILRTLSAAVGAGCQPAGWLTSASALAAESVHRDDWRWGFYLVVPPGILLGILAMFMREPARGQSEGAVPRAVVRISWKDYLGLFRIPSYTLNTLGMTAMTFAFGGLAFWMPTYLAEERRPEPLWGIDPATMFGGLTALAGLTATLTGGFLGDRLRSRYSGSYFLVSGVTMIVGFPLFMLVLKTPFQLNWLVIFATVFCLFINTGPTNTILANVTPPAIRANAFALNIFIIHILGDVISPSIIGLIRDYTPDHSFAPAFTVISIMILVGGVFWLLGARHLAEDTRLAPTRPVGF